jgi:hypothetical protein
MNMETRKANVNISFAGGTAAAGSKTYKVTLPTAWIKAMGIDESRRMLDLSFDGSQIRISQNLSYKEFLKQKIDLKHDVRIYNFYDNDTLCSTICADFTDETIAVENHEDNPIKTAFGNNESPTWQEFLAFLEDRCIPRGRDGLREYLETLGLSEYSPLDIIKKTSGRVAEDNQWLEEENCKWQ